MLTSLSSVTGFLQRRAFILPGVPCPPQVRLDVALSELLLNLAAGDYGDYNGIPSVFYGFDCTLG